MSQYMLPAAIVVAAVLRFWGLGDQSYWYDEWDTAYMTQLSFGGMLDRMHVELSPPIYFAVTWLWSKPFGDSEFALRSISALAGVALIPILYLAAKELLNRRAGLIAAWLAAINPVLIWYSQEARAYSLMLLLTAISFLFFIRATRGDRRALLWWSISSATALATHYLAGAVLVPMALLLFFRSPLTRRDTALGIGLITVVGLALIPMINSQLGHSGWIDLLPLRPRVEGVVQNFAVGFYSPNWWLPLLPLIGLATVVYHALRHGTEEERRALYLAGGIGLVGAAILVLPVAIGNDYITTRNLLGLWVPLGLAAAIALAVRRLDWLGPAAVVALAAISIPLVVWTATDPNLQRPDWDDLAEAVDPPTDRRAWVSLGARGFNAVPLELYLPQTERLNRKSAPRVREVVLVRTKLIDSKALGTCFWGAMCNGNSGGYPFRAPAGFQLIQSGETDRFEFLSYRSEEPIRLPVFGQRGRFMEYPEGGGLPG